MDWEFALNAAQVAALTRDMHRRLRRHAAHDGRAYAHKASYPIFLLSFDTVIAGKHMHLSDLRATKFTGRIHHHLAADDGDAFIGATSLPPPHAKAMGEVRSLFTSPLNWRIDAGVHALAREPKLLGVRLLVVPQLYITALWMHRPTHHAIYLVDAPGGFALLPHALYTDAEFIAALRSYYLGRAKRKHAAAEKRPSRLKVVRYDGAKSWRIADGTAKTHRRETPVEPGSGDDDPARRSRHETVDREI
jgi:hypothetical protein